MKNPFIECDDIIKIFKHPSKNESFATLRGISMKIKIGDFITIIGPSGCGKTTLLKILTGELNPSAGVVRIRGSSIYSIPFFKLQEIRRQDIGILYQNPRKNIIWDLSILDNVKFPIVYNSIYKKKKVIEEKAISLLKELDLNDKLYSKPSSLSGGELQRVGVAIVRANSPKLYILDEPTSQLDYLTGENIINSFKQLCDKNESSVILVTHKQQFIDISTKSFIMKNGILINSK